MAGHRSAHNRRKEERKGGRGEKAATCRQGCGKNRGVGGGSSPLKPLVLKNPHWRPVQWRWCQPPRKVPSSRLGEGSPGAVDSSWGDGKPGGSMPCPDSHFPWWLLAGIQSSEGHLAGGSYPKTHAKHGFCWARAQMGVSQGRGVGGSFSEQAAGIKSGRRPLPQNHSKKRVCCPHFQCWVAVSHGVEGATPRWRFVSGVARTCTQG